MTIEWIRELCPEIAEWQAELIAQEIKSLRKANEKFAKRKMLWNEARAFDLKEAVAEERETCALLCEKMMSSRSDDWQYDGACVDCANAIRARGDA